jgi:DNA (cytosine-5)-methyltransferase 1
MENVKNLVGKKFKPQFDKWLEYLSSLGYTNYWKVLNAKDYGIPQNRERVFVVSILGEHKPYEFPKKLELTKKLKDILEEETDNKHHLSDNTIKKIIVVDKNIKPSVRLNFEREKNEISKSDKEIYQCKCNSGWQDNKVGIKVAPTLRANNPHTCIYSDFRIKKLTPKECFRLMGMDDNDIQKIIDSGISNTQQYKLAGNSIVINILEYIFKNLFIS